MAALLNPVAPAPLPVRVIGLGMVDWAVIAIGGPMATLVFFNVSLHLIHKDLAWVTELGELLMVWVTFLGGACAAQRGAHMTITEFIDKLTPARRRWADAAVQALCLVACCWCWCATAGRSWPATGATS
jgi:TRAP-type C4-dicarboxylate transport system permease small subunit